MTRLQLLMLGQTLPIVVGILVDVYLKRRLIRQIDGVIAKWDAKSLFNQAKG